MTKLYIGWQDRRNRGLHPIGCLTRLESEPVEYEFAYLNGAKYVKAVPHAFGVPVPGFPTIGDSYRSPNVFSVFRYRAMNPSRPDRPEYLESLGLDTETSDVIDELAVSGGGILGDFYEFFPAIKPDRDGKFDARFVVRGIQHLRPPATERVNDLTSNERLNLSLMTNGPYGDTTLGVKIDDQQLLGWLPRYLVDVLYDEHGEKATDLDLRVVQVNYKAPLDHRLLVELTGRFPPGTDPMSKLDQYQPISSN